jgi:hypothetical protein
MPSNYGPIVSAWDVEQAVRDTLKAWIDTFLGEKERQSAGRWSPRQIQRPRSWFIQSAFHDIPEQLLPVIHVESATKTSRHADGGRVDGQWAMNVQGVVKGRNRQTSREMLGLYEACCSVILEKHGDLGGIASGVTLSGARYDLISPDRDRTLVGFEIPIIVSVDHIADRFGGPTAPDSPAPTPLPVTSPSDPAHTSTHVIVTTE